MYKDLLTYINFLKQCYKDGREAGLSFMRHCILQQIEKERKINR